jgi:MutS domain V
VLTLPDLLHTEPRAAPDGELLEEILETAFLGGDPGIRLDDALSVAPPSPSTWNGDFFADELFVDELIAGCFVVHLDGRDFPVHRKFLRRILCRPPVDAAGLAFRQAIVRELRDDGELRRRVENLYRHLFHLLSQFKAPGSGARLDYTAFRLEILLQAKRVIDQMADDFAGARSGLRRLHEAGREIQASGEYRLLASLLDYEGHLADLTLQVRVAADGRIRSLHVEKLTENAGNPFHRPPLRRWLARLRLLWLGFKLDRREMVDRVVVQVYLEIAPALRGLLQLIGHLEFYLAAFGFAALAEQRGLTVSLAEIAGDGRLRLDALFNPLLLRHGGRPVPCTIAAGAASPIVIVTGPNSGGKTRMLQAVGLAQLLGQSGVFAPAAAARIPLLEGLFATLVERASADQTEGRLGAELLRIRRLFLDLRPRSLILLDELCSGTNPSEAVEIFTMVLALLRELRPLAFITTHFLDFARDLGQRADGGLEFLQVEVGAGGRPTYQFRPGVAETSLAVHTAERLGVTYDELARLIRERAERGDGG